MNSNRFLFTTGFGGLAAVLAATWLFFYEPLLALVFITTVLHTVPFWVNIIKGKDIDFFEPINFCLLSSFILFVFRPLYYYFYKGMTVKLVTMEFAPDVFMKLLVKEQYLVILALTGLLLGYYSPIFKRRARLLPAPPSQFPGFGIKATMVFMLSLSLLSALFFFHRVGGLNYYIANRTNRVLMFKGNTVFYKVAISAALIAFFMWLISRKKLRKLNVILFMGITIVYLSVFTSRTPLVFLIVTTLVFWHYRVKKIRGPKILIFATITVVVAFSLIVLRVAQQARTNFLAKPVETFIDKNMFSDKGFMLILHEAPENIPFKYGRTLINSFLFFIPRAVYPQKPVDIGLEITHKYFDIKGGFNITFPGELYLNFHAPGVFFGMLFLGLMVGLLKHYREKHADNPSVVIIYAASCFWLFDIIYKNLWHFLAGMTWNVLSLALVLFLFKLWLKPVKEPEG
jgi:oligosaccharide repeat unit polymerase